MTDPLPTARALLQAAALVLALITPAGADEASPWAKGAQSEARLIEGRGPADGRPLLAGLEIRLHRDFITYWRDPGDAGVPPTFSFAGSTNLKSATVQYPAPLALDEAGVRAFGYEDDVTFPILVEPEDAGQPVTLRVVLDYAACHDICLPAHAALALVLDGRPSAEEGRVRDALAAVPRRATVGAGEAPPSIRGVTPSGEGGFTVEAEAEGGTLFVEAPEGWAYRSGPPVAAGPGRVLFSVHRLDGPAGAERPPGRVTLTLVAPAGAVEVPIQLDGASAGP